MCAEMIALHAAHLFETVFEDVDSTLLRHSHPGQQTEQGALAAAAGTLDEDTLARTVMIDSTCLLRFFCFDLLIAQFSHFSHFPDNIQFISFAVRRT